MHAQEYRRKAHSSVSYVSNVALIKPVDDQWSRLNDHGLDGIRRWRNEQYEGNGPGLVRVAMLIPLILKNSCNTLLVMEEGGVTVSRTSQLMYTLEVLIPVKGAIQ